MLNIPAGYKLVPIEPTETMVVCGFESRPHPFFSKPEDWEAFAAMTGCQQAAHKARLCYAAMLDAAPTPPSVAPGDAQDSVTVLPDGSAFALASFPLPATHWLYAEREYAPGAEEPKELPAPILTHAQRDAVVAAVRYAVRGATMCGKEQDFDPDALVQNAVYALCGPYGSAAPAAGDALPDFDIEAAAQKMAECMDYPWAHMPEQGRTHMRKYAQAVIDAALAAQVPQQGEA